MFKESTVPKIHLNLFLRKCAVLYIWKFKVNLIGKVYLSFIIFPFKVLLINIVKSRIGLENYQIISTKNDTTVGSRNSWRVTWLLLGHSIISFPQHWRGKLKQNVYYCSGWMNICRHGKQPCLLALKVPASFFGKTSFELFFTYSTPLGITAGFLVFLCNFLDFSYWHITMRLLHLEIKR